MYIQDNKEYFEGLVKFLLEKYEYASVLVEDSISKFYKVDKNTTNIAERDMLTNRGMVIRVFDKNKLAEYSTNILEDYEKILDNIVFADDYVYYDTILNDEKLEINGINKPGKEINDEYILNTIKEITETGLKDSDVINFHTIFGYCTSKKLFLSKNKNLYQENTWAQGHEAAFVKQGEKIKEYFKGFSTLGGMELLDQMKKEIPNVIRTAKELLESVPLPPGKYECICDPATTGMIVHEAFGHGVEMDMFVKNRALAKNAINTQVASRLITMHDSACSVKESATYSFDDEGNVSTDTVVIKDGILKTGMCDALSASRLDIKPTGNGRRENFEHKAYTRMTNTYFESGDSNVEDMIRSIKDGLFLENPFSGMEDPKNWGIQCMVNIAREIKDGHFTGKIYSPIVLTGFVPDVLKSITMISKDEKLFGSGFCGKGHKEWCKVSDGGPYIKATITLG